MYIYISENFTGHQITQAQLLLQCLPRLALVGLGRRLLNTRGRPLLAASLVGLGNRFLGRDLLAS